MPLIPELSLRTLLPSSLALALAAAACGSALPIPAPRPASVAAPPSAPLIPLKPPEAFAGIADPIARSRAIFAEMSRVMLHPRCMNCHPNDDSPRERENAAMHDPPVTRGLDDRGAPERRCASCHQDKNLEATRVPGALNWHLAPRSSAWMGRTAAQICEQIKDPARNGKRDLFQLVVHAANAPAVGWAWAPGADLQPVPGTREGYVALVNAWVGAGAACPVDEAPQR